MEKIIITREGEKIIDWSFNEEVDCDYYEYGEELLSCCVNSGADITDLFNLTFNDIPKSFYVSFLTSLISNDIFVGYGIKRNDYDIEIIFFIDDVLEVGSINEINPYEYLSTLEKLATAREGFAVESELTFDSVGFSMILTAKVKVQNSIRDIFYDGYKKMDTLLNQVESELKRFYSLIRSNRFNIQTPSEIKTSIRQYLLFFEEFVKNSKAKDISVNVTKSETGVEVTIIPNDDVSMIDISDWFYEYINLVQQDKNNIKVNFEQNITPYQADLLIADLKNEIAHLKNSIEIANIKHKYLSSENDFLRQFVTNLLPERVTNTEIQNVDINKLKEGISNSKFDDVIKNLKNIYSSDNDNFNNVVLISAKYSDLKKKIINDGISHNKEMREKNKIANSLLQLIDKIKLE